MIRPVGISRLRNLLWLFLFTLGLPSLYADQWTTPTKEELFMTSQAQVPGAPAVVLFKEEITDDHLHMWSVYVRLKVLTEKGKDYSNVELNYASERDGGGYTVGDISGRTIHPDGAVIPFTGKPYEKLIEKTQGAKFMAKVFTLPDVEIGSIIEYRFTRRYDDHYFIPPHWYIQSELFTRNAHYVWKPTGQQLISNDDRGQLTNSIAWFPVLPADAKLQQTRLPAATMQREQLVFELNVHDVPPSPEEEFMPPIKSFSYRVLFYYTPYRTFDEFWTSEGKYWSKRRDKFIGPGPKVTAAVHQLTTPSDTPDQKLRKLYAAVMRLENTDFTRERTTTEEKAQGLGEIRTTDDILERKRGSGDQLAELFVAMARAAGMKSYLVFVTSRDRSLFTANYPSLSQLDDYIAIVNVDGKEQFFDPGSRYCPYQHLAWKHSFVNGIRQTDNGTAIAETPGDSYKASRVERIADLTLDDHGVATGSLKMTYTGAPALNWRNRALSGDDASLRRELRTSVEHLLPGGMDVQVISIEKLEDYEQPLVVRFNVKGAIGSTTGKRLLLLGDIFMTNAKPTFPHEKRDVPVDLQYPQMIQDAMRITFPTSIKVESSPAPDKFQFKNYAAYALSSTPGTNSITMRRDLLFGEVLYLPKEYPELREFYNKFETKDQENIVLTATPAAAAKPSTGN